MVLAYDLLEDRRTIDVIFTEFLPLCLKMAESFENLDNILRGWEKDKVQKSLTEALKRFGKQEEESRFFENKIRKNTRTISVCSRARPNQAQNWC